jgi:heme-degrading monooxygenase HmoA
MVTPPERKHQMIIREWRGRATLSNPEGYPKHFRDHVAPDLRNVPGFVGASVSKRSVNGKIEFLVLTRWESLDCIKSFAGSDIAKAVVEPGAVAALVDFDDTVQHYECLEEI